MLVNTLMPKCGDTIVVLHFDLELDVYVYKVLGSDDLLKFRGCEIN